MHDLFDDIISISHWAMHNNYNLVDNLDVNTILILVYLIL